MALAWQKGVPPFMYRMSRASDLQACELILTSIQTRDKRQAEIAKATREIMR